MSELWDAGTHLCLWSELSVCILYLWGFMTSCMWCHLVCWQGLKFLSWGSCICFGLDDRESWWRRRNGMNEGPVFVKVEVMEEVSCYVHFNCFHHWGDGCDGCWLFVSSEFWERLMWVMWVEAWFYHWCLVVRIVGGCRQVDWGPCNLYMPPGEVEV